MRALTLLGSLWVILLAWFFWLWVLPGMWLSQALQGERDGRMACLQGQRAKPLSHDHFFRLVLGLAQVTTALVRPELNLFEPVRQAHWKLGTIRL
jgi:hypothetical protein